MEGGAGDQRKRTENCETGFVPKLNGGGTGDLLARVRIAVPGTLSKQEREALEKLSEIERSDHGDPREKLFEERAG